MFENLTKDAVVFHLLNFSKNKWLDSRYFYNALVERTDFSEASTLLNLKAFQRELANVMNEIEDDQSIYQNHTLVRSEAGYKFAVTEQDFITGYNYVYSKIILPLKRLKQINEMRIKTIYGKDAGVTDDIFSNAL